MAWTPSQGCIFSAGNEATHPFDNKIKIKKIIIDATGTAPAKTISLDGNAVLTWVGADANDSHEMDFGEGQWFNTLATSGTVNATVTVIVA